MDDAALARVEQQRVELEANIAKLRKALRHWQALEIDYESLQEEFLIIDKDSNAEQCMLAVKDAGLEVVDEKDLRELLFDSTSRPRKPPQVIGLLTKRAEYVARNVETVRKQLSAEEKKRNALLLAEEAEHRDEAGLPLAEITEELDANGKIISSKVQTPATETDQLIDVLKKAGVNDIDQINGTITQLDAHDKVKTTEDSPDDAQTSSKVTVDDGKLSPDAAKDDTEQADDMPTNPSDTAAEAELRRDMLNYSRGLDEVGQTVAELEVDEAESDVSFDENELDLDFDSEPEDDLEDDESEDDTGKSKHALSLSTGYQKKMEALQEKLGLKNVGPRAGPEPATDNERQAERPAPAEAARKAALARQAAIEANVEDADDVAKMLTTKNEKKNDKKKPAKKKVAFSEELDIAPVEQKAATSVTQPEPASQTTIPAVRPVRDSIIERDLDESTKDKSDPPSAPKVEAKQSRFKAARQSQPQTPKHAKSMQLPTVASEETSAGPKLSGPTVATTLVERPASSKAPKAPDPYDFSDESHRRDIALEFEQHRIKRILAQDGGFVGNGEDGEVTPLEDEDGKRISRFKAARIHR